MTWFGYSRDEAPSPISRASQASSIGTPAAASKAPQDLAPLCFCVVCRTDNRPHPRRWCRGCGADLVEHEALLRGGIFALLDATAPTHLSGKQFYQTLRGEDLVRLYSEVFHVWESTIPARRTLWPPDVPPPLAGVPAEVSRALGRLGMLVEGVDLDQLRWVYRTLSKVHHPDSGGDPSGARMKLLTAAYDTVTKWFEAGCPRVATPEAATAYQAAPTAPSASEPVDERLKVRVRKTPLKQSSRPTPGAGPQTRRDGNRPPNAPRGR